MAGDRAQVNAACELLLDVGQQRRDDFPRASQVSRRRRRQRIGITATVRD
jgi:hypothetical protein